MKRMVIALLLGVILTAALGGTAIAASTLAVSPTTFDAVTPIALTGTGYQPYQTVYLGARFYDKYGHQLQVAGFGNDKADATGAIEYYIAGGVYSLTSGLSINDIAKVQFETGGPGVETAYLTVALQPVSAQTYINLQLNKLVQYTRYYTEGGLENSLVSKLENVRQSVARDNYKAAGNQLEAFINEVEAQNGKEIQYGAGTLISMARNILASLTGGPGTGL